MDAYETNLTVSSGSSVSVTQC